MWVVGGGWSRREKESSCYLYSEQALALSILPHSWQQPKQALGKGLHTVTQTVNDQVHQPKGLHNQVHCSPHTNKLNIRFDIQQQVMMSEPQGSDITACLFTGLAQISEEKQICPKTQMELQSMQHFQR